MITLSSVTVDASLEFISVSLRRERCGQALRYVYLGLDTRRHPMTPDFFGPTPFPPVLIDELATRWHESFLKGFWSIITTDLIENNHLAVNGVLLPPSLVSQ